MKLVVRLLGVVSVLGAALAVSTSAQQQTVIVGGPPPAVDGLPPVAFEVTSVKLNKSGDPFISISTNAGRFTATNFPLRLLIQNAFRLQPNQLVGGPDWLGDRYDIVGKIPEGVSPARQQEMVRALLADRFELATHAETRELPIYALVMARSDSRLGPTLSLTKNDCTANAGRGRRAGGPPAAGPPSFPQAGSRPPCGTFGAPGALSAGGITMARLAEMLSGNVGRTVVDRTGLAGFYEFDLTYTPDRIPGGAGGPGPGLPPGVPAPPAIDPNGPSLFTALQEQLGLKLDSTRGPVEVTVIDRVERPTED
jgi:uncharacterized protein (TIGR03435 family)